uniref:hypothetical protein n=1 Tax=Fibrocapsa japonica TaxID=94617 RepID=UPI002114F2DC|nr:hypothetical protein NQZ09_pgp011 [Fibrocapsa japonica]UTE95093.1 hypothetical protein FjapPt_p011 [Fibrocapsa japonica]
MSSLLYLELRKYQSEVQKSTLKKHKKAIFITTFGAILAIFLFSSSSHCCFAKVNPTYRKILKTEPKKLIKNQKIITNYYTSKKIEEKLLIRSGGLGDYPKKYL